MEVEYKRLFFGFDIEVPWPDAFPSGRMLEEKSRHLTFAFLGRCDFSKLKNHLDELPLPSFKVGFVGKFDQCLFLPPKHPNVVAWHVEWLEEIDSLLAYYKTLVEWLEKIECPADLRHEFNPHVTICRSPFDEKRWKEHFTPLPMMTTNFQLFESTGNLTYIPIKTIPILPPFEEIEHTADIAFHIIGENLNALFHHAQAALAFTFPPILDFFSHAIDFGTIHDVIIALNEIVSSADHKIGCPFKAVSFHGTPEKRDQLYHWEMIIDV